MKSREILIGVTGGIAVYKTAALVSQLVQAGAKCLRRDDGSGNALRGTTTFAALTGRPVATDVFEHGYPLGGHITMAETADLLCVAPATANFLAKAAHGIADDLLVHPLPVLCRARALGSRHEQRDVGKARRPTQCPATAIRRSAVRGTGRRLAQLPKTRHRTHGVPRDHLRGHSEDARRMTKAKYRSLRRLPAQPRSPLATVRVNCRRTDFPIRPGKRTGSPESVLRPDAQIIPFVLSRSLRFRRGENSAIRRFPPAPPRMARILITSGPTREYLDPVRYLTNASSGRMGQGSPRRRSPWDTA